MIQSVELGRSAAMPPEPEGEACENWLGRIARSEPEAFEALFRAFYTRLCAFAATYVRSPDAAEEIVNDVFLRLWTERNRLEIHGSVKGYLYTAVRNRAFSHLSRRKIERRYAERVQQNDAWERRDVVADDIEERLQTTELTAMVLQAVETLPARARQTYVLYYQHHLSYAEIAKVMSVSVKTVENQLSRSLKMLWLRFKDVLT